MANKPLKSIQFPGLSDTYTVPQVDATLATTGAAADAKKTGDEISSLKLDINRLDDLSYGFANNSMPTTLFEHGSLSATGANDSYRASSRARTKTIISFNALSVLTVKTGDYVVDWFNSEDTYTSSTGWKTVGDNIIIPANQKFRILVSLDKSASASRSDPLTDIVATLVFKNDNVLSKKLDVYDIEFERGSLLNGENDSYRNSTRIRSVHVLKFPFSVVLSMSSGSYAIHELYDNGDFKVDTAWRSTEKYIIPPDTKFRLLLTSNTSATETDYATMQEIINGLNFGCIANQKGNSPNIVYQCRNVDDTKYPPYTKYYIKAASKNQYDRVRFNVRKTTDGYYFLCHDDTINSEARNSDGTTISSSISTNGRTLAELNSYDWGIKYGTHYAGLTVPMLEDSLYYASVYNLGVTVEFSSLTGWTDEDTENVIELFDKYGVTDNLIVIDPEGLNTTFLGKFVTHNPRVSCYVGGTYAEVSTAINDIKGLQTDYNKIYATLYPWGTPATDEFIALAKENNLVLYNAFVMSKTDLLDSDTFSTGYNLIEANNVYAIKDTVQLWIDDTING